MHLWLLTSMWWTALFSKKQGLNHLNWKSGVNVSLNFSKFVLKISWLVMVYGSYLSSSSLNFCLSCFVAASRRYAWISSHDTCSMIASICCSSGLICSWSVTLVAISSSKIFHWNIPKNYMLEIKISRHTKGQITYPFYNCH